MKTISLAITIVFCIVPVIIMIYAFRKFHRPLKKILKESSTLENKIKEVVQGKNFDNLHLIYTITDENTDILGKHIQRYRQDVLSNKHQERIIDIGGYLSPNTLLSYYGERKFAESISGILTGIGIFGTFLGLVIGLSQLNIENLRPSIQNLMGGMDIAFISSVVAIFCSLLWSFIDRNLISNFHKELLSLVDTISERLPIRNESDILEEIVAYQKEEIDTMRSFFSDVLIPKLVSGVGDAIKEHLAPEIEKMGLTVDSVAQFSASRQAEGIQQLVEKISGVFDVTLDRQFKELAESMNSITANQAQAAEQLQDLLEYFEAQTREQATLVEQTKDLLTELRGCLVNLRDAHTYLSENVKYLNSIHERLLKLQTEVNTWVSSINEEQDRLVELREGQIEVINNQITYLKESWESLLSGVIRLNKTCGDSIERFNDNIHNGLDGTFNIFDENLTTISQTLATTIDDLNLTVESLPNSFKALQITLQDFDNQSKEVLRRFEEHEQTAKGEFKKIRSNFKDQNEENIKIIKENININMEKLEDEVKEMMEENTNKKTGIFSVFRGGKS